MHHMHHRRRAVWLASSLVFAAWGCDGRPSVTSSQSLATVKGTVTVNGKKADSGAVVFDGANSSRSLAPVRGEIGKDGSYEVKAYVGGNKVALAGASLIKQSPVIQYERLTFDVQGGDNTFDIVVPSKK